MTTAAANPQLMGVVGPATRVTIWRRLHRVFMYYSDGRHTVHKGVAFKTMNDLEHDLAAQNWRMTIANVCRSEWKP